ncbi:MAG: FkbM family methyltransferase, partial [Deltaproteobacteria bacterium]
LLGCLARGMTFFDVGSHVGYYSLCAARAVGPEGRVVAFEASAENYRFLCAHIERNRLSQVEAHHLGIAARPGRRRFRPGRGSGTGRLDPERETDPAEGDGALVEVTSLDAFCTSRGLRPQVLKIDVEGGEVEVLDGAAALLAAERPILLLSTHGAPLAAACRQRLSPLGYRFEPMDSPADLFCHVPR